MPIAILKYRLPEEQDEFEQARLAPKYAGALEEFYRWIRGKHKHGNSRCAEQAVYTECFNEFLRACRERGFDPVTGLP